MSDDIAELIEELDRLDNLSLTRDLNIVELGVKHNIEAILDAIT